MSWISKNEKNVLTSVIPAMLAKTVKTSELQAEAMRLFTELKQPQFNGNMGRERGHVCFWLLMRKRIIADCKVLICVSVHVFSTDRHLSTLDIWLHTLDLLG